MFSLAFRGRNDEGTGDEELVGSRQLVATCDWKPVH